MRTVAIILVFSVMAHVATSGRGGTPFYDMCQGRGASGENGTVVASEVLCIGASDNVPSVSGKDDGGCIGSRSCQVALLVRKVGPKYEFKIAAPQDDSKSVMIRVTVTSTSQLFVLTKKFPDNLVYIDGMTKSPGELSNVVWIKFSRLPTPACLNSLEPLCADSDFSTGHFIPAPPDHTSDNMYIFPFETADEKIYFLAKSSPLDGEGEASKINVHLATEEIVISIHHVTAPWIESEAGTKYPDGEATLVNLIETTRFKLFEQVPDFVNQRQQQGSDLAWVWILIAVIVIVVLLCLLFWYIKKKREKQIEDGHVDVSGSSYSSIGRPGNYTRSNVSSNALSSNKDAGSHMLGSDARSGILTTPSSHDANKSHTDPSSLASSPKSSSPVPLKAVFTPASVSKASKQLSGPKSASASHKSSGSKK